MTPQPPSGPAGSARTAGGPPWVRLVDGGRTAPRRSERRPAPTARRVLGQFVVANLVAVALLLAGSVWASARAAEAESVADARATTDVLTTVLIEPALTDGVLTGDEAALAALDDVVTDALRDTELVRIKIWDASGRIVWSDEPRLVGAEYSLGEDEQEALATGETKAEISDLSKPENRFERSRGVLLEVYRRVSTPSGDRLLFETYLRYDEATARQRDIWLTFAPISATVLLLLLAFQLPLGSRMVRQLRAGEAERLGLQERAADASTDERRRIAGSLHDGIVQDMAAVSYVLAGSAERLAADQSPTTTAEVTEDVRTAADTVRGAVAALRSLLIEIYPAQLAQAGLPPALRGLADRLRPHEATLQVDVPDDLAVPPDVAALIFRVAQEALINVGKHAAATEVVLRAARETDRVVLEVVDDGAGFDPAAAAAAGHFGLRVLTDLAAAAGATLELATAPGRGTALRMGIPLP